MVPRRPSESLSTETQHLNKKAQELQPQQPGISSSLASFLELKANTSKSYAFKGYWGRSPGLGFWLWADNRLPGDCSDPESVPGKSNVPLMRTGSRGVTLVLYRRRAIARVKAGVQDLGVRSDELFGIFIHVDENRLVSKLPAYVQAWKMGRRT
jgi:hypothetical protein